MLNDAGKPVLLDLYCKAGGCTKGYQRAGFYVIGVDAEPQPNYCGDEFHRGEVIGLLERMLKVDSAEFSGIAAVHASPPCQAYALVSGFHQVHAEHPDLVGPTRRLLDALGLPYVIENVVGAPVRPDLVLCGEMFGLRVFRHRVFETSGFLAMRLTHSPHRLRGAKTNCEKGPGVARWITGHYADHDDASDAMGIDWMDRGELAQAVPPAYTEYVGGFLRSAVAPPARVGSPT